MPRFLARVSLQCNRAVLAFVAGLAFLLLVGSALAGAATRRAADQGVASWTPCYQQFGPFECATVDVPVDYDNPSGAKVGIALVRLPATDAANRIGSLFLNPGGPGGSGVDFTIFAGPHLYTSELRARFDLVGFDPRGTERSDPLRCFDSPDQWPNYYGVVAYPTTSDEVREWIAKDRIVDEACKRRGGVIGSHMSTANVARDLDLLRQAVGDDKLSYAGFSYGSLLGTTYANLFPGKVRALVLDGITDPVGWTTGQGKDAHTTPYSARLDAAQGAQDTLNEFFRLCDLSAACAFGPNSASRYAALAAQAKTAPITVHFPDGSDGELNYSTLIALTIGTLADSSSWTDFAQFLAGAEAAGTSPFAADTGRSAFAPAYTAPSDFPDYQNFIEAGPGVACSDSDNPRDYPAWTRAADKADAQGGYFGRIFVWGSSVCAKWPFSDTDRYTGPFDRWTANPVLIVGNQFDPVTSYHSAVSLAHLLPNSRLLTVHAWGHTSLFRSSCADAAVANYLIHLTLPPESTICEQDARPFAP